MVTNSCQSPVFARNLCCIVSTICFTLFAHLGFGFLRDPVPGDGLCLAAAILKSAEHTTTYICDVKNPNYPVAYNDPVALLSAAASFMITTVRTNKLSRLLELVVFVRMSLLAN
jgi:hypothetical protein